MRRILNVSHWLLAASFLSLSGAAPAQTTPPGLRDLVGARGAGGETQLQARGYRFVRAQSGDDRKWTYWWNPAQRQCISVATVNGRYAAITATPAPDCGQRAEARPPRPGPAYPPSRPDRDRDRDDGFVDISGRRVDLGLVCFGDGQRPALATTYGWSWDSRRDRYQYGNRTELSAQQFDASVMIQLWGDGGRIRLPKKLIPPINSRGSDGWWDLYDVSMRPNLITAQYRLNGLNKPRITINRTSGQITIEGTSPYRFRGTCDLIDGRDHRRF